MTDIPDDVAKLVDWLPKKRYMDLYQEGEGAIHKRIHTKVWKEGVHWSRPEGAGIWISIKAVNEWAAKSAAHSSD